MTGGERRVHAMSEPVWTTSARKKNQAESPRRSTLGFCGLYSIQGPHAPLRRDDAEPEQHEAEPREAARRADRDAHAGFTTELAAAPGETPRDRRRRGRLRPRGLPDDQPRAAPRLGADPRRR